MLIKQGEQDTLRFRLLEKIDPVRGGLEFSFGDEFYSLLNKHKSSYMHCPEALWKINLSKNPYAYYLLRKFAVHKRINLTEGRQKNADTLSVKALLNILPLFPTFEDVQNSGRNTSRRIIKPFERDMNALSSVLSRLSPFRKSGQRKPGKNE